MISLEVLTNQLAQEREVNRLAPLPHNFINDTKQYIQQLQDESYNTLKYQEQMMLRDEEKNARIILEGIIDRRFAKLIDISLIYASGINNIDPASFDKVEREAFDILVKAIKDARTKLES